MTVKGCYYLLIYWFIGCVINFFLCVVALVFVLRLLSFVVSRVESMLARAKRNEFYFNKEGRNENVLDSALL